MTHSGYLSYAAGRLSMAVMVLVMVLLAPLAACTSIMPSPLPTAPAAIADQTVIDEKAMIAVEQAYLAIGSAVSAATSAGVIRGSLATRVEAADAKAYTAIRAMRAAYDAGNASGFNEALQQARSAIDLVKGLLSQVRPAQPDVRVP